jgi:hypothetical protein
MGPPTDPSNRINFDATTQGPDNGGAARWTARPGFGATAGNVVGTFPAQTATAGWGSHGPQIVSAAPGGPAPAPAPARPPTASSGPARPQSAPATIPVYQLKTAACPSCRQPATLLAPDRAAHAWWCCAHCGSLADLDVRPDLDPFIPPEGFRADRRMKTKTGRLRKAPPTDGRVFAMLAAIHTSNDLSPQEALTLARRALVTHGDH